MRKCNKAALMIGIAEVIVVMGGITACGAKKDNVVPQQETVVASETQQPDMPQQETVSSEVQQETTPISETPLTSVQSDVAQATAAQPDTSQQNSNQRDLGGDGQISLDAAKSAALADAGVSASDVIYTKEKLDYEDGIAVYDIEFYADNVEYEYEINATTGAVYSKSMETHHNQNGHQGIAGTTGTDIGVERAKAIALNHAGFAETDVSRLKIEFDIDDGLAVYEVEFDKNGIEYEYTINAADGSIIEYDVD